MTGSGATTLKGFARRSAPAIRRHRCACTKSTTLQPTAQIAIRTGDHLNPLSRTATIGTSDENGWAICSIKNIAGGAVTIGSAGSRRCVPTATRSENGRRNLTDAANQSQ